MSGLGTLSILNQTGVALTLPNRRISHLLSETSLKIIFPTVCLAEFWIDVQS